MATEPTFNPWDESVFPDPHPLYRRMRSEAPVYRGIGPVTGRPIWFLTRYDDVVTALKDRRLGREIDRLPEPLQDQHRLAEDEALEMVNRHLLNLDPPDHTRLRRLVSSAFTNKRVADLAPRIEEITSRLLDQAGDEFDLIAALALPLPITVIAELLGIPIEDQMRFRELVDRILRPDQAEAAIAAGMEFFQYINERIEARRRDPGDDLLSALIHLEEEGDRLDHRELLSMVWLLLIAGHETTVNLIGNGMLELMSHRDARERIAAEPELIDSAIEEMLRFNGPVGTTFPRFPYEDFEIGGTTIPCGDLVIPVLLAANRDPEHFPEPDRFDIARAPNKHVAFGFGVHYCLGAPLARLEARTAIGALVERHPRLELAVDRSDLEWTPDFFLRGVRRLPVTV